MDIIASPAGKAQESIAEMAEMKNWRLLRHAIWIVFGILGLPFACQARGANHSKAEVRIIILPPRATAQELRGSVKLFRNTKTHDDLAASFQKIDDAGLSGEWYISQRIPKGEYEVHVSVGAESPDIVRLVKIEAASEQLYFTSEVTSAHLLVVDPFGDPLPDVIVDKVVDDFGTNYAAQFDKTLSARIPFGVYQLQVHVEGLGYANSVSCFCSTTSWSVLGVSPSGGDVVYPGATIRLKGFLKRTESIHQATIIRFVPAYIPSSMETVVEAGDDGRFEIAGTLPAVGDYIVSLTRGHNTVGTAAVRLPLEKSTIVSFGDGEEMSLEPEK